MIIFKRLTTYICIYIDREREGEGWEREGGRGMPILTGL